MSFILVTLQVVSELTVAQTKKELRRKLDWLTRGLGADIMVDSEGTLTFSSHQLDPTLKLSGHSIQRDSVLRVASHAAGALPGGAKTIKSTVKSKVHDKTLMTDATLFSNAINYCETSNRTTSVDFKSMPKPLMQMCHRCICDGHGRDGHTCRIWHETRSSI